MKIPEVAPHIHLITFLIEIMLKSNENLFSLSDFFPKQNFQLATELYLRDYQRINKINEMTMRRFLSVPLILLIFSLNIN